MSTDWTRRPEGGGRLAIWLIRAVAVHLGRPAGRLLLYPITLYFLLVRGPERRASRAFLGRVFGRPARLREVARHIHSFACTILDRVFLLSERFRRIEVQVHGLAELHAEMDKGRGLLLLGSHLGSFEALRVLSLTREDITVRVVLDRGQNPAITQLLEALNPKIAQTVIDAGQGGTQIVLQIKEAAEAGAIIGMLADRARPGDAAIRCPFLGAPAPIPAAPFLIAAALQIPVVLCFGLYRGGRSYDLHFEPFADPVRIDRRGRSTALAAVAGVYAQRLEHYARLAPYNWFNFYDFWQTDALASNPAAGPGRELGADRA